MTEPKRTDESSDELRGKNIILLFCLRCFLLFVPVFTLSCTDNAMDLPEVRVGSSAHFNYYVREEDNSFCEGLLEVMEQHFSLIQSHLGFEWPAGEKINYYKFLDIDDYQRSTGRDYWANAQERGETTMVLSPEPFHQHELMHAYLYPTGLSFPLLTEGLAETYSRGGRCLFGFPSDISFDDAFHDSEMVYVYGCPWAGFLLNTWGAQKILSIYAALPVDASIEEANEQFVSTLGVSAEDTWRMMLEENDETKRVIPVWHCNAPELSIDGTVQLIAADCRRPFYERTFILNDDALVSLKPDIFPSWLFRCDLAPSPVAVDSVSPTQGNLFLLKAGRYLFKPQWADNPTTAGTEMEFYGAPLSSSAWMGISCADLSESMPFEDGTLLSIPAESGDTYIRLNLPGSPDPTNRPPPGLRRCTWMNAAATPD